MVWWIPSPSSYMAWVVCWDSLSIRFSQNIMHLQSGIIGVGRSHQDAAAASVFCHVLLGGFDGSLAPQGSSMGGDRVSSRSLTCKLSYPRPPPPPVCSCSHELLRYYPLLSSPCLFLVLWLSHPAGVWVVMRAFGFRFPTPFLVCVCCLLWFLSSTSDLGFQQQGDFSLLDSLNVPGVWSKSGHFPGRFCCMLTPCVFVQTWLLNGKK